MRLSRTVAYGLQAALLLAEEGSSPPIPCSRLAAKGKLPERFLIQILRRLVAHGILTSARGAEGGYALGRPAERVSLLDVIEAVDGPVAAVVPCSDGLSGRPKAKLTEALSNITETIRRELDGVKLADLLPE
jgi:Rrf2 family protein